MLNSTQPLSTTQRGMRGWPAIYELTVLPGCEHWPVLYELTECQELGEHCLIWTQQVSIKLSERRPALSLELQCCWYSLPAVSLRILSALSSVDCPGIHRLSSKLHSRWRSSSFPQVEKTKIPKVGSWVRELAWGFTSVNVSGISPISPMSKWDHTTIILSQTHLDGFLLLYLKWQF